MSVSSVQMDGKVKIINPESLLNKTHSPQLTVLGVPTLPTLAEDYFVESSYAVMDCEYIETRRQCDTDLEEFFVVGMDDGTVHAYPYSKKKN